jgi:hypothetical protein
MNDILEKFPSLAGIARALDMSPNAVVRWRQRGLIPAEHFVGLTAFAKRLGIKGITVEMLDRRRKQAVAEKRAARENGKVAA